MDRFRSWNGLRLERIALVALVACGPIIGCGPGRGEVSGTVRYNGKPLPSGTIQFLGSDGVPCAGTIHSDGTFSVQVPAGEAKVIVSCLDEAKLKQYSGALMAAKGRGIPPSQPGKLSLIPLRYADWTNSGLTVVVTSGKTEQDFNLISH
jgi:hypothetical protein